MPIDPRENRSVSLSRALSMTFRKRAIDALDDVKAVLFHRSVAFPFRYPYLAPPIAATFINHVVLGADIKLISRSPLR